ncbi:hypothetical protein ACFPRL_27065 [Pseudoclavibacter helvolus]
MHAEVAEVDGPGRFVAEGEHVAVRHRRGRRDPDYRVRVEVAVVRHLHARPDTVTEVLRLAEHARVRSLQSKVELHEPGRAEPAERAALVALHAQRTRLPELVHDHLPVLAVRADPVEAITPVAELQHVRVVHVPEHLNLAGPVLTLGVELPVPLRVPLRVRRHGHGVVQTFHLDHVEPRLHHPRPVHDQAVVGELDMEVGERSEVQRFHYGLLVSARMRRSSICRASASSDDEPRPSMVM